MASLDTSGIRAARKTVARWFCGAESRRFLPLTGPGISVSRSEELAIAAASEAFIAERFDRMNDRLGLCFLLMVAATVLTFFYGAPSSAGIVIIATLTIGGPAMLFVAWRYERALLDLQDAIALALRERAAGELAELALPTSQREPDFRKLARIAYGLAGLVLLWPLATILLKLLGLSDASTLALGTGVAAIAGVVTGVLAFAALWAWLRRRVAPSEDGAG